MFRRSENKKIRMNQHLSETTHRNRQSNAIHSTFVARQMTGYCCSGVSSDKNDYPPDTRGPHGPENSAIDAVANYVPREYRLFTADPGVGAASENELDAGPC